MPRRNTSWECSEGFREEDRARADVSILHLILEAGKVCHMEGLKDIWIGSRWSVRSLSEPKPLYDSATFPVVLAELHSPIQRDVLSLTQGYHTPDPLGLPAHIAAE